MKFHTLLITLPFALLLMACEKDDPVQPSSQSCTTGTLRVSNTSVNTVQRIMISGTNHGTLDPGETRHLPLAPGNWTLQFVGLAGGQGCTQSSFNIAACQTISRACSH